MRLAILLSAIVICACNAPAPRCVDAVDDDEVEEFEAERDPGEVPSAIAMVEAEEEGWQGAAPERTIRFLAVGDTGTGDGGQWMVANAMTEACRSPYRPECNFVLMLGDNFYPSGLPGGDAPLRDGLWKERFIRPYAGLPLPFYAVAGNHDYGAGGSGLLAVFGEPGAERAALQLNGAAGTPPCDALDGPGWCMPSLAYNRQVPFAGGHSATLVAIDTTSALFGDSHESQREDLQRALARPARWRFVFGHHTYRSSGFHGSRSDVSGLGKLLRAAAASSDLILTGHDHHLEFRVPEGDDSAAVVVSGAGAKLRPGAVAADDTVEAVYNGRGFFDVIASEHYLEVMLVGLESPGAPEVGGESERCSEMRAAARAEFAWCKKHGEKVWQRGFCPRAAFW